MTWAVLLAVVGTAVVLGVAWLLGRPRSAEHLGGLGEDTDDDALPERFAGREVDAGFAPQVRGYRMDQVDAVVDALEVRLAGHDLLIADLRGEPEPSAATRATAPAAALVPGTDTATLDAARRDPPGEDEPPPRPGPAAGRDEAPAAGRLVPLPLRRSDLWAPLAYLLGAVWVMSGVIADLRSGYL
ncbi:MAG TPA: hypothetical protein VES93_15260, partial [Ornithinibacter sp.]|nr:hypothetical protein [Ornithinibacter sp.]